MVYVIVDACHLIFTSLLFKLFYNCNRILVLKLSIWTYLLYTVNGTVHGFSWILIHRKVYCCSARGVFFYFNILTMYMSLLFKLLKPMIYNVCVFDADFCLDTRKNCPIKCRRIFFILRMAHTPRLVPIHLEKSGWKYNKLEIVYYINKLHVHVFYNMYQIELSSFK